MQEGDMQLAEYAAIAAVYSRHKVVKQQTIPKISSSKMCGWLDCCIEIRHRLEISNYCEKQKTVYQSYSFLVISFPIFHHSILNLLAQKMWWAELYLYFENKFKNLWEQVFN